MFNTVVQSESNVVWLSYGPAIYPGPMHLAVWFGDFPSKASAGQQIACMARAREAEHWRLAKASKDQTPRGVPRDATQHNDLEWRAQRNAWSLRERKALWFYVLST